MQLTDQETTLLTRQIREMCGVVLDSTKGYLIEHRLSPIIEEFGCRSYNDLYLRLRQSGDQRIIARVIDAITTNETSFFRDRTPFEAVAHRVLPDMIDALGSNAQGRGFRLWSAAASTGQEAYSLAISILETLPDPDEWNVKIIGTDISESALEQARSGRYAAHEARRGLSENALERWFTREGNAFLVRPEVQRLVTFRHQNLLDPFDHLGPFDIIFCRNVAIYFDESTKADLFRRMAETLRGNGYIFGSGAEYLDTYCPSLRQQRHCGAVYYCKSG